jgi:hypothetical protein
MMSDNRCLICGKEMRFITNTHLAKHNLTCSEYSQKFGVKTAWNATEYLTEEQKAINRENFLKIRYTGDPWNKNLDISDERVAKYTKTRNETIRNRGYLFTNEIKKIIGDKNKIPKPSVGIGLRKYFAEHELTEAQLSALKMGREVDIEGIGQYQREFNYAKKWFIKSRDGWTCQVCGKEGCELAVHHIDYNKCNCFLDNLITLCESCHGKTRINRKYWIEYFKRYMHESAFNCGLEMKKLVEV